jgi:RuvB-like protein 1 (pontin 52)
MQTPENYLHIYSRYVVQLLTPAKILSQTNGKTIISKDDIEEIFSLFWDAKSSTKLLKEQSTKYLQ